MNTGSVVIAIVVGLGTAGWFAHVLWDTVREMLSNKQYVAAILVSVFVLVLAVLLGILIGMMIFSLSVSPQSQG